MTTSTVDEIQLRETRHVLQTYRRHPLTLVRGEGVRLYDADGHEYLDLLSGIGVASLGHAHPGLAAAIADQLLLSTRLGATSVPRPGLVELSRRRARSLTVAVLIRNHAGLLLRFRRFHE